LNAEKQAARGLKFELGKAEIRLAATTQSLQPLSSAMHHDSG